MIIPVKGGKWFDTKTSYSADGEDIAYTLYLTRTNVFIGVYETPFLGVRTAIQLNNLEEVVSWCIRCRIHNFKKLPYDTMVEIQGEMCKREL